MRSLSFFICTAVGIEPTTIGLYSNVQMLFPSCPPPLSCGKNKSKEGFSLTYPQQWESNPRSLACTCFPPSDEQISTAEQCAGMLCSPTNYVIGAKWRIVMLHAPISWPQGDSLNSMRSPWEVSFLSYREWKSVCESGVLRRLKQIRCLVRALRVRTLYQFLNTESY